MGVDLLKEELEDLIEDCESSICDGCDKQDFCEEYDTEVCEALSILRTLVKQGRVNVDYVRKALSEFRELRSKIDGEFGFCSIS